MRPPADRRTVVALGAEVIVDDIQNDAEPAAVRGVDEALEP